MKEKEIHGEGWDIDPMLDVSAATITRNENKPRYHKPVDFFPCTHCSKSKVSIIADGTHLVWKPHERVTMSGARMMCAASGAPLCTNPPRGILLNLRCPHPLRQTVETTEEGAT